MSHVCQNVAIQTPKSHGCQNVAIQTAEDVVVTYEKEGERETERERGTEREREDEGESNEKYRDAMFVLKEKRKRRSSLAHRKRFSWPKR